MNISPFASDATSSWLLYILTDSALPTGGFVASSGLEAMFQAGLLTNDNITAFVTSSAHSFSCQTLAFVKAGYDAMDDPDPIARLDDVDDHCDAVMVANAVARRASLAQGVAMLTLYLKCFTESRPAQDVALVKKWKLQIRAGTINGHFPVCFGLVCRLLDVDRENTLHLWLYLFTRTLYSSAVRLNLLGPYEAQRLLLKSRDDVESVIEQTNHITMDDSCQTNPLLDVCQGMHDRLYTRLFNS
ncbi:urease accessory protein UreF [Hesseltinella vesiculosa]|uniref:Urease accessory protein UreF n=1 Tax=Hesseltinella vesiculosa TaxID=101127 RepID=A0A1X2GFS1_9FUNG|nr:urease accessory protein UreF [Hesseltinella vesiculosa]